MYVCLSGCTLSATFLWKSYERLQKEADVRVMIVCVWVEEREEQIESGRKKARNREREQVCS